jgi:hypothetical protein
MTLKRIGICNDFDAIVQEEKFKEGVQSVSTILLRKVEQRGFTPSQSRGLLVAEPET